MSRDVFALVVTMNLEMVVVVMVVMVVMLVMVVVVVVVFKVPS